MGLLGWGPSKGKFKVTYVSLFIQFPSCLSIIINHHSKTTCVVGSVNTVGGVTVLDAETEVLWTIF